MKQTLSLHKHTYKQTGLPSNKTYTYIYSYMLIRLCVVGHTGHKSDIYVYIYVTYDVNRRLC